MDPGGAVAEGRLGDHERVVDHLGHDVGVARHARSQRTRVGIVDLDLDLEVGDVLDAFPHRADLAHGPREDPIREGLGPDPGRLSERHARDLVLVDQALEVHAAGGGDRQEQGAPRDGGDRRDRVALLDVDVEHAARERGADRRVAELHLERVEAGPHASEFGAGTVVARARVVAIAQGGGAAGRERLATFKLELGEASAHVGSPHAGLGLAYLGLEDLAIELDEQGSGLDESARGDSDLLDDARDARPDLDLLGRLDRARGDDDSLDPAPFDRGRGGRGRGLARLAGEDQNERDEDPGRPADPERAGTSRGGSARHTTSSGDTDAIRAPQARQDPEGARAGVPLAKMAPSGDAGRHASTATVDPDRSHARASSGRPVRVERAARPVRGEARDGRDDSGRADTTDCRKEGQEPHGRVASRAESSRSGSGRGSPGGPWGGKAAVTMDASSQRSAALADLERRRFDLIVIGGGITGAGIAREASRRGLEVALFDATDFAAGTSSRSSKLIHGGLRYLAMGDVATVRATALERKVIHRLAPHLAEPHWMLVPTRSRAGLLKVRAGVTTYEKLGAVEQADRHFNWGQDDLAEHEPTLDRDLYHHACVYREYLTDDARLVLANLRAAAAAGAVVLNHAPVEAITKEGARADGVEVACQVSGARARVRGRCIVNATGPWVDSLRALEDDSAAPRLLLSKGVHIVLRRERLPVRHILILDTRDKRSIFVIPRGRSVYVGTTDTTYDRGHEVWPEIRLEDVRYLLEPLERSFTVDPLGPRDVFAAWAGLRPLIFKEGSKSPSEIPRKDEVWIGPAGMVTIAGGKLTGYRPMAQATLETAAEAAGFRLGEAPDEQALPGGEFGGDVDALAAELARGSDLAGSTATRFARLYGSEAHQVLALGAEPLTPDPDVLTGEVDWAVREEWAVQLADVVYRRLRPALYHPEAREAGLEPIARRMGSLLGWDAETERREIAETRALLDAELAFRDEVAAA